MDKKKNENVNIVDVLLDEDNEDPVVLYDEKDKEIRFDQIAIIPLDDKLYAILKPIDDVPGIADDEAMVFAILDDVDGEAGVALEKDEPTAMRVFDEYYKLLDEQEEKHERECGCRDCDYHDDHDDDGK